jgi:signal transduction histidine kinase
MNRWMRLSLKRRIALLTGLLGVTLSAGFAAAAWLIIEDFENQMMGVLIDAEVQAARPALAKGGSPRMPASGRLRGWHLPPNTPPPADLPPGLAQLPDGVHEELPGLPPRLHATLVTIDGHRLVYLMDLERIEELETRLLVVSLLILLIGGWVSALGGRWLALEALGPLARLADHIDGLPARPDGQTLAPASDDPQLRRVGSALDRYQRRLREVERDRERFFADASHELRSPIASLGSAVELLLEDPSMSAASRRRLDRIGRAVDELVQLLDGLLLTARAVPEPARGCRLGDPLLQALSRLEARAVARGVALPSPRGLPGPWLAVPPEWIEVLLLNLLRSVIDHPGVRALHLSVEGDAMLVSARGIDPVDWRERSDRGFSLHLARSLGERVGVTIDPLDDGLSIDFTVVAAVPEREAVQAPRADLPRA